MALWTLSSARAGCTPKSDTKINRAAQAFIFLEPRFPENRFLGPNLLEARFLEANDAQICADDQIGRPIALADNALAFKFEFKIGNGI